MSWFLFALAAPVLLTVVNFIDKYIVEREVRDARAMPIFAGITGTLAAVLLLALGTATLLSARDTLLLMAVAPTVFREAVSWRDRLRKVAFALVLLVGLYLVLAQ